MKNKITPLKAIRSKCLDCCCFQTKEVKLCHIDGCPLHEFRFGKNPYQKKTLTEEDRSMLRERFQENISK